MIEFDELRNQLGMIDKIIIREESSSGQLVSQVVSGGLTACSGVLSLLYGGD